MFMLAFLLCWQLAHIWLCGTQGIKGRAACRPCSAVMYRNIAGLPAFVGKHCLPACVCKHSLAPSAAVWVRVQGSSCLRQHLCVVVANCSAADVVCAVSVMVVTAAMLGQQGYEHRHKCSDPACHSRQQRSRHVWKQWRTAPPAG